MSVRKSIWGLGLSRLVYPSTRFLRMYFVLSFTIALDAQFTERITATYVLGLRTLYVNGIVRSLVSAFVTVFSGLPLLSTTDCIAIRNRIVFSSSKPAVSWSWSLNSKFRGFCWIKDLIRS